MKNISDSLISATASVNSVSVLSSVVALVASLILGLVLNWLYSKVQKGPSSQKNFGLTIIAVAMITTLIVITINGNVALSLGLVGALSIVRFRAPIKDSLDIVFIYWAIAIGIANAVTFYFISIPATILIAFTVYYFEISKNIFNINRYLIVVRLNAEFYGEEYQKKFEVLMSKGKYKLSTSSLNANYGEYIYEYECKNGNHTRVLSSIQNMENIKEVSLLNL